MSKVKRISHKAQLLIEVLYYSTCVCSTLGFL